MGPMARASRVLQLRLSFPLQGCGCPHRCWGLCPDPELCSQGSSGRSPRCHCPLCVDLQGNTSQRFCLPSGCRNPVLPCPGFPPIPSPLPQLSYHPQQQRLSKNLRRQVPVFGSFLLRRKTMKKQKPRKSRREEGACVLRKCYNQQN